MRPASRNRFVFNVSVINRLKGAVAMALAFFVLGACSTPFTTWVENGYLSQRYQQDSLMLVDPKGDALLIRQLDTIPVKLAYFLFREPLPQLEGEDETPFVIGKSPSIDCDCLLDQFAAVMRNHYPEIVPVIGEEHRWSPEAQRYLSYGFWHRLWRFGTGKQQDRPVPLFKRTKLFLCLACGWTSRFCVTGQEEELARWILSCPDRSVQIHQLFEESYVLNRGNLYLTFLCCENVLCGQPHRAGRSSDPLQQKLTYIRNDSPPLGDNYGAWYHFYGIALYGMLRAGVVSRMVADTEILGSYIYEGADRQETLINRHGARFGRRFRKMIADGSWL